MTIILNLILLVSTLLALRAIGYWCGVGYCFYKAITNENHIAQERFAEGAGAIAVKAIAWSAWSVGLLIVYVMSK